VRRRRLASNRKRIASSRGDAGGLSRRDTGSTRSRRGASQPQQQASASSAASSSPSSSSSSASERAQAAAGSATLAHAPDNDDEHDKEGEAEAEAESDGAGSGQFSPAEMNPIPSESSKTVLLAFGGNAVITLLKTVMWFRSGSSAMLAEAIHTFVDTVNQGLLLMGLRQSMVAPDKIHQYGYGRAAFFWGLVSALGLFWCGAGVTIFHGEAVLCVVCALWHVTLTLTLTVIVTVTLTLLSLTPARTLRSCFSAH
jgi:hypothetical protein